MMKFETTYKSYGINVSYDAILIYQGGKVGSSSIYDTLANSLLNVPIYHCHTLSLMKHDVENIPLNAPLYKKYSFLDSLDKETFSIMCREYRSVYNHLFGGLCKKVKIISMFRDPIARNISSYFQNLHLFFPDYLEQWSDGRLDVFELIEHFFSETNHLYPILWFEQELENVFGVKLDSIDYDQILGFGQYYSEKCDVFIMRNDKIDDLFESEGAKFLELNSICLERSNEASQKNYFQIYKSFKKNISFSENYINDLYDNAVMKMFFSELEISDLRNKWLHNDE